MNYPPKAYRSDDDPSTVYVLVPCGHFAALRLGGKWKRASLTMGHLEDNYRLIEEPGVALNLLKEAREAL